MAEPYRDRALVVRHHDLGEADRIIVLLTRDHGIVRAVAKGVRRSRSRFGSRMSPFVDVDVQIHPGRGLHTVTGADTVATWAAPIVADYARYTCACAALEAAERLISEEAAPNPALWELTRATLARLADPDADPGLALTAHLLRAMAAAGWDPSLFDCAQCGRAGPHHAFSPAAGGAVCVRCRPPGAATPPTEVLRLMWWLRHGDAAAVAAAAARPGFGQLAAAARGLAAAHLQYHIGRRVGALALVEARWGEDGPGAAPPAPGPPGDPA